MVKALIDETHSVNTGARAATAMILYCMRINYAIPRTKALISPWYCLVDSLE
jgi:hypothetical protein